ncbi:hypothetical protein [Clostridium sp. C105KSO13]|uniref:hypothetical protein n=1 Tax=Clostridium sp. C105KSO13 TaxID=1776045 RepID=UPI0007408282|nr:hypothetical protein [Clostridium sp. C105KSO13]CUX30576.1 hypothetical protein BN3456_01253 [Clostridium sp. C105KSO13]
MEKKPSKPMIPFDELVNPPMLQMLKLFLPYTPASNQKFLGIFAKFLEFKETISFFQGSNYDLQAQSRNENQSSSPLEMLTELKPYLPPREAEMIETLLNMMNMMEVMRTFTDNPETASSGEGNPMDMAMGMLTPEQQDMFQMYNSMFSTEGDSNKEDLKEGDDVNERMDEQSGDEGSGSRQASADSDGSFTDQR